MSRYIVYYKIQPTFENAPREMNAQDFFLAYKPVEVLQASHLEEVYTRMQGENWSPNGEMRAYIRMLGLSHTSMSVGDVVYSEEDGEFFSVAKFSFEVLTLTNN